MRRGLGIALALMASPAWGGVKAGVDAWSRGDYATAIREWRDPANNGNADAQFNLGQAYKLGRGVAVDLKLAEDWYRRAALQGHIQAEDNYGLVMFQNGNRLKALPYLEKSAARGEPRAQYLLATALFNGDMVKRDWPRAYALMTRASAAGLGPASASLTQMDRYIPLADRQKGQAMARALESGAARPPIVAERTSKLATTPAPKAKAVKKEIVAAKPKPMRETSAPPTSKPRPVPPPMVVSAEGRWRIQLGAFSDPRGALALWGKLGGKLTGLQPYYVKTGAITRLQAGGLTDKAAANRACNAVRSASQPCLVIAP